MITMFPLAFMTAIMAFIVSIPESVALFASAVGLVTAAVLLRRLLGRGEMEKGNDNVVKKA